MEDNPSIYLNPKKTKPGRLQFTVREWILIVIIAALAMALWRERTREREPVFIRTVEQHIVVDP
jgi:hypothetical protein